jgi:hypothetical protein
VLGVIDGDGCDDGCKRPLEDVGGVEPAAKTDFEQKHVGRMPREQQQSRRGRQLEYGDRCSVIDTLAFREHVCQFLIGHQNAAARASQAKSLIEPNEVRRRISVDAIPRLLENRAHERDRRALTVGAGNVDRRRESKFGVIELFEQTPHAIE